MLLIYVYLNGPGSLYNVGLPWKDWRPRREPRGNWPRHRLRSCWEKLIWRGSRRCRLWKRLAGLNKPGWWHGLSGWRGKSWRRRASGKRRGRIFWGAVGGLERGGGGVDGGGRLRGRRGGVRG